MELLGTCSFPLSSLWLPNNRLGEPRTRFEFVITFRESRSFKSSFCLLSRSLCCLSVLRGLYRFSNFPIGPNLVPVPFCRFRVSFFPNSGDLIWNGNKAGLESVLSWVKKSLKRGMCFGNFLYRTASCLGQRPSPQIALNSRLWVSFRFFRKGCKCYGELTKYFYLMRRKLWTEIHIGSVVYNIFQGQGYLHVYVKLTVKS